MEFRVQGGHQKASERMEIHSGRERAMSLPAVLHYNQEIAHHSKLKQYDLACQAYDRMLQHGVLPDVVTYNTMINVYVKSQRLQDAFLLFEEMKQKNIDLTIVTYTSLIDGCGKCNQYGFAMLLYKQFRESKIVPNMHIFNAILNAGLLNGVIDIVDSVLEDISKFNLKPNTVTCNTLLAGYTRFDQLSKMKSVVRMMISQNVDFSPVTQTTILQAALLVKDEESLRKFCELTEEARFIPSKIQASQAIMDLINVKRLVLAQQLLHYFLSKGFFISEEVFSELLYLAGRFNNLKIIKWTIDTATSMGIAFQNQILASKLDVMSNTGQVDMITSMIDSSKLKLHSLPLSTRLNIIKCYISAGYMHQSYTLLESFQHDSLKSADTDFLIRKYFSMQQFRYALNAFLLFKGLSEQKGTNCAYLSSIKLERHGDLLSYLEKHPPSTSILAQFIPALSCDQLNSVSWTHVFQSLRTVARSCHVHSIMKTFVAASMVDVAWQFFKRAVEIGAEISSEEVSLALSCRGDNPSSSDLLYLIAVSRDNNAMISTTLYSQMITSYIRCGNYADAFILKQEIDSSGVHLPDHIQRIVSVALNNIQDALPKDGPIHSKSYFSMTRRRSNTLPRIKLNRSTAEFDDLTDIF